MGLDITVLSLSLLCFKWLSFNTLVGEASKKVCFGTTSSTSINVRMCSICMKNHARKGLNGRVAEASCRRRLLLELLSALRAFSNSQPFYAFKVSTVPWQLKSQNDGEYVRFRAFDKWCLTVLFSEERAYPYSLI